jgi:alpha-tubulin suppressor-like RCC1 family protein
VFKSVCSLSVSLLHVVDFSTSWHHAAAWLKDGRLFMMGENKCGELGVGHKDVATGPQEVVQGLNREKVVKVCTGGHHTLCLTSARNVYAWGDNFWHQSSHESNETVLTPHRVSFPDPTAKFVDVACTVESSFALSTDGVVNALIVYSSLFIF